MKRLHWAKRQSTRSPGGAAVCNLGLCIGYWPCLEAPFARVSLGHYHYELWYGLPSYRTEAPSMSTLGG